MTRTEFNPLVRTNRVLNNDYLESSGSPTRWEVDRQPAEPYGGEG